MDRSIDRAALQSDLENALDADPDNKDYYIRQALQRTVTPPTESVTDE